MATLIAAQTTSRQTSHQGPLAALAIGLMLLVSAAAVLVVAAATPTLQPLASDGRGAAVTAAAAREFYAAEDKALATGDMQRLIAAVAPGFVDHRPGAATRQLRAGLISHVAALRIARPGARLTIQAILVEGDRALVYVSMVPPDPAP